MKTATWTRSLVFAICCSVLSLTLPCAFGADKADPKATIQRAHKAYYSLRGRGFLQFQANVKVNWRLILKDAIAENPSNAETALKLLDGIHFTLVLDEKDAVNVTHQVDSAPDGQQAEAFKQIFDGMQEGISGFFSTWSLFMLNTPFPAVDSDYQLQDKGDEYLLTYKEGATDVATTMSKDLVIREMIISDTTYRSSIKPRFESSAQGYLLIGYDATYKATNGTQSTELSVLVENREVNGQQLPSKLNLAGKYEGHPFNSEFAFDNYQVKNR